MDLSTLKHYNEIERLKYLAYLQVCPENSSHLERLQELQNMVLEGEDISLDYSLWSELEDSQNGLFVENYICHNVCQFRAFVSDATERPWQLCVLVESLIKYKKLSYRDLYTVIFFLLLSDKLALRLGFEYYVLGNYSSSEEIQLLDLDERKYKNLEFTEDDFKLLVKFDIENFDFIDEYCRKDNCNVKLNPILKTEGGYFILSPNALMNCAWRELLKDMKSKMTDEEINDFYHSVLAKEIHNSFAERWMHIKELMGNGDNAYTAVFLLHNHHYLVVSIVSKKTRYIDINVVDSTEDIDYLDLSSYIDLMYEKVKIFDKEAHIVQVVIPITMQNEFALFITNCKTPTLMIQWQPLKTFLKKEDNNAMWLYYYALDRSNTQVMISPDAKEEDVIALYLKYKKSFYFSDKAIGKQMVYVQQGFALPLLFDIKWHAYAHTIFDYPYNIIVEKEQDSPKGLPFYEVKTGDCDLMLGEFMISHIFIQLPKNTKELYPELHAIGRSILLWCYAFEKRVGNPIFMHNIKLLIESDDTIANGFILKEGDYSSTLKVGQNLLGNSDSHDLEKRLLTSVICDAVKKGCVSCREYNALINEMFEECKGGLIYRISGHDLLCDNTIGDRSHYVVDGRRKSQVIGELAEKFNHFPEGPLTIDESRNLVDSMILYLNNRIITILEQYDLEKFLLSLSKLRDGLIFWSRAMHERYNSMISFYRFLRTDDPVQEKRIFEFIETDLCTRCLIEYAMIKCTRHGEKDIHEDIDSIEEIFALMSELVNMGYLSDYYKSSSFNKVIEVLPNGRFAYPQGEDTGLSKYAKLVTSDRLEHPDIYDKLNKLVEELDYKEYEDIFRNVFNFEFGIEFNHFSSITTAIIQLMQDEKKGYLLEEISAFRNKIVFAAKVDLSIVNAYISAFSITESFRDLSYFYMFRESDTFPCRYKRKLGLIYRPICVFHSNGTDIVVFSYRGFVQSQYNLLDNIRISNYSSISKEMGEYIGQLNNRRGKNFETGVYKLYKQSSNIICHRSAQIGPKDKLFNPESSLGDIDIMLIDNETKRILLIEAKNYNECKTPYEAVIYEKKMLKDMSKVEKRDKWARDNKDLFEYYAKTKTADYRVASIMLTYNLCPVKFFCENYETPLPIIWIRDVIENPLSIFEFGHYY